MKDIKIVYRAGRENVVADALSRIPEGETPLTTSVETETQVAVVSTKEDSQDVMSLDEEVPVVTPGYNSQSDLVSLQNGDPWC